MSMDQPTAEELIRSIQELNRNMSRGGSGGYRGGGGPSGGSGGGGSTGWLDGLRNNVTRTFSGVAGAASHLGPAFIDQKVRISDSAEALKALTPLVGRFGSALNGVIDGAGGMVRMVEEGIRELDRVHSVGASFNNSVLQMKNSAAQARLSLQDYSYMVRENSEMFAGLGGTVTDGTREFEKFSRMMFEQTDENGVGLANSLVRMGFTIEDINDAMISYAATNRRQMAMGNIPMDKAAEAAHRMATEMDLIAKLTGKDRKSLQAEADQAIVKGQVQAAFKELEARGVMDARDEFKQVHQMLNATLGPAAARAYEQAFASKSNVPLASDQEAMAMYQAMGDLLPSLVQASKDDSISAVDTYHSKAGQTQALMDSWTSVVREAGRGSAFTDAVAEGYGSQAAMNDAIAGEMAKTGADRQSAYESLMQRAADEQKASDGITNTVRQSELQIKNASAALNDALFSSAGTVTEWSNSLKDLSTSMESITATQVQDNLDLFADKLNQVQEYLGEQLESVQAAPVQVSQPKSVTSETRDDIVDVVGFLDANQRSLNESQQQMAKTIVTLIDSNFKELTMQSFSEAAHARNLPDPAAYVQELIEGNRNDELNKILRDISRVASESEYYNKNNLSEREMARRITDEAKRMELGEAVSGVKDKLDSITISANRVDINGEPVSRRTGSLGMTGSIMENFGSGTLAVLHGREGVITESQYQAMVNSTNELSKMSLATGINAGLTAVSRVSENFSGTDHNDLTAYFENLKDHLDKKQPSTDTVYNPTINSSIAVNTGDFDNKLADSTNDLKDYYKQIITENLDFSPFLSANQQFKRSINEFETRLKSVDVNQLSEQITKSITSMMDNGSKITIDNDRISDEIYQLLESRITGLSINNDAVQQQIQSLLESRIHGLQLDNQQISTEILNLVQDQTVGIDTAPIHEHILNILESRIHGLDLDETGISDHVRQILDQRVHGLDIDSDAVVTDIQSLLNDRITGVSFDSEAIRSQIHGLLDDRVTELNFNNTDIQSQIRTLLDTRITGFNLAPIVDEIRSTISDNTTGLDVDNDSVLDHIHNILESRISGLAVDPVQVVNDIREIISERTTGLHIDNDSVFENIQSLLESRIGGLSIDPTTVVSDIRNILESRIDGLSIDPTTVVSDIRNILESRISGIDIPAQSVERLITDVFERQTTGLDVDNEHIKNQTVQMIQDHISKLNVGDIQTSFTDQIGTQLTGFDINSDLITSNIVQNVTGNLDSVKIDNDALYNSIQSHLQSKFDELTTESKTSVQVNMDGIASVLRDQGNLVESAVTRVTDVNYQFTDSTIKSLSDELKRIPDTQTEFVEEFSRIMTEFIDQMRTEQTKPAQTTYEKPEVEKPITTDINAQMLTTLQQIQSATERLVRVTKGKSADVYQH